MKLICRPSYAAAAEVMGSPFDRPLSSRRDENDSGTIFEQVLVPWENLFVYRDVKINEFSRYDRFATWPVNGTPRPA